MFQPDDSQLASLRRRCTAQDGTTFADCEWSEEHGALVIKERGDSRWYTTRVLLDENGWPRQLDERDVKDVQERNWRRVNDADDTVAWLRATQEANLHAGREEARHARRNMKKAMRRAEEKGPCTHGGVRAFCGLCDRIEPDPRKAPGAMVHDGYVVIDRRRVG